MLFNIFCQNRTNKEQIRKKKKEEYLQIYKNLEEWVKINPNLQMDCGRLFEYTWHLLLANRIVIPRPIKNVTYGYSNLNRSNPCKFQQNN